MIEEEAEKKYLNLDDEDFLDFSDEEKLKAFKAGANFVLHANRWRKVSEELPEVKESESYPILVKEENGNVSSIYISASNVIGYIKNNFQEWKPID